MSAACLSRILTNSDPACFRAMKAALERIQPLSLNMDIARARAIQRGFQALHLLYDFRFNPKHYCEYRFGSKWYYDHEYRFDPE